MKSKIGFIHKLWHSRWVFRSLLYTVYFNFHYFSWKQAIRLPVLLYKPRLLRCGGRVILNADDIYTGMVILGKDTVSVYPNSGFVWECSGEVVFSGRCYIGNSSALSVSSTGKVVFGNGFYASAALKLIAYYSVCFSEDVHMGWDCVVMDTDLHKMVSLHGDKSIKGYGDVSIGRGNWLGMKCKILKNTHTPDYCTVSASSLLNKDYREIGSYSIIGTEAKVVLKKRDFYRNFDDDNIEYE